MKTIFLVIVSSFIFSDFSYAGCTPVGDESTYGINNVWIGYVYGGNSFNRYSGYVNEGSAASPSFDENFGGASVSYATNGCALLTDTFSVRYKLSKTFTDGDYIFTVGGDDGYRFSIDGGSTWAVSNWAAHGYTTSTYTVHLNGSYNLVLEYYEDFIDNRVSFDVVKSCTGSGNPAIYGTNNQWIGYVYSGTNFNTYKGSVTEGTVANADFDENFGGDYANYVTSDCSVYTEQISVRYRLKTMLPGGTYTFTVGGDDGYRLSLDGGSSFIINKWGDQSYNTTTYTATLGGTYDMVLEYYENGGGNRISFSISGGAVLPITLANVKGILNDQQEVVLSWSTMMENNVNHYEIQRSADGKEFVDMASVQSKMKINTSDYQLNYSYTDVQTLAGTSYYRIKIIGENGSSTQSPVIQINNMTVSTGARIYPTIIQNNMVFVESNKSLSAVRMEFFDLSGRKISETEIGELNGRQSVSVSKSATLPMGTYVARLTSGGRNVKTQMVIVQN